MRFSGVSPVSFRDRQDCDVELDVVNVFGWLLRRWRLLLVVAAACTALMVAYYFTLPPRYTAEVSILPRAGAGSMGLLGRLAGFGGMLPNADDNLESMYGKIVYSDAVLDTICGRSWLVEKEGDPQPLWNALELEVPEDAKTNDKRILTKRHLRRDVIRFDRDYDTGYMVLKVTVADHPRLAADLANAIVTALNRFNVEFRTQKSSEKRAFIEDRLSELERELDQATSALAGFSARNRNYAASPVLRQRYSELEREMEAKKSVWIELKRQLELVKIEANRETTVIDVLDSATPPPSRSGPFLYVHVAVGLVLGFFVALIVLGIHAVWQRLRAARAVP